VVTAALEIQRQDKVIGASLEAAPVVHVADPEVLAALKTVDFADICITSAIQLTGDPIPQEAFRLPEVEGVGVVFEMAEGEKCQRCWKILPDVGTHRHPGVCAAATRLLRAEPRTGRDLSRSARAFPSMECLEARAGTCLLRSWRRRARKFPARLRSAGPCRRQSLGL
jgi:hypothetical protein